MPVKKKTTKKEITKKASLKQRKALKGALENGGKIGPAMKAAGYSPAMVKNPQKLKASDGWQSLLEGIGLSDLDLAKKNKEHIDAATLQKYSFEGVISDDVIHNIFAEIDGMKVLYISKIKSSSGKTVIAKVAIVRVPEYMVQDKALDKALKIRGAYKNDGAPLVALQVNQVLNDKKKQYGI